MEVVRGYKCINIYVHMAFNLRFRLLGLGFSEVLSVWD